MAGEHLKLQASLGWQRAQQLEWLVVKLKASAKLDELFLLQLLVWLFPVYQLQEMDCFHHPGDADQQDKPFS